MSNVILVSAAAKKLNDTMETEAGHRNGIPALCRERMYFRHMQFVETCCDEVLQL